MWSNTKFLTTIEGKAEDFGVASANYYYIRLVDDDISLVPDVDFDDILISITGRYSRVLNWSDDVEFMIYFRLKCDSDCKIVRGVSTEIVNIYVNDIPLGKPTLNNLYGNQNPPVLLNGEYSFTPGGDSDDGGQEELAMEVDFPDRKNFGSMIFGCEDISDVIDADIDPKHINKTLTILIPGEDENREEGTFSVHVKSLADLEVNLYDMRVLWYEDYNTLREDLIPNGVEYYIPYTTEKIIGPGQNRDDNLTFSVDYNAKEGDYRFDAFIYYYYEPDPDVDTRVYGYVRADPFLSLINFELPVDVTDTPTITLSPLHPIITSDMRCDTANCHTSIKGSSSNLFSIVILGIFLMIISILVIKYKK